MTRRSWIPDRLARASARYPGATKQQAEQVVDGITGLLCTDPDHAPPCPIPWSITLLADDDGDLDDAYPDLVEQARHERHLRP